MDAVFTLPYPEYSIASTLQKTFKKKLGYSVQIPLSRQQKGIDLLLYNQRSKKAVSIQIKGSRVWPGDNTKKRRKLRRVFQHYSWNNKFKFEKGLADFYFFFLLYPKGKFIGRKLNKEKDVRKWWDNRLVVFNENEMGRFLKTIKTAKGRDGLFFSFGFDEQGKDIYHCRGAVSPVSCNRNLFENKIKEIKARLK